MSLATLLIVILILVLVGAFPRWPHSAEWGYGPSSLTAVALFIVLLLLVTGRL